MNGIESVSSSKVSVLALKEFPLIRRVKLLYDQQQFWHGRTACVMIATHNNKISIEYLEPM